MPDRDPVAGALVSFLERLTSDPIPPRVTEAARTRVIDTLAVGVAGTSSRSIRRIADAMVHEYPAKPRVSSRVWGTGQMTTPGTAALVNAAAAHAEDFDDTHTGAVMHGSACVVPVAWAAAEADDLSWDRLVAGVVAGWEVAARIGQASGGAFHRRGMHPTSIGGVFGGAYAVSVMRGLGVGAMLDALGLCGSAVSGLNAYLQNGSDGKLLNPGFAARSAFDAVALASAGVTGPHNVLDGRHGVFEAFGDGPQDLADRFATLGDEWEIDRVSIKPFPACHFTHAAIDCAIELYRHGVDPDRIDRVSVRLPEATWDLVARPWDAKLAPTSAYQVRFSIPWLIAIALLDGDIGRATFTEELLSREDVRALAHRVDIEEWTHGGYPHAFPGEVEVALDDGSTLKQTGTINRGHPDRPLSSEDLIAKTRDCLSDASLDAATFLTVLETADPTSPVRDIASRALGPASV